MGICQGLNQTFFFLALTLTFWSVPMKERSFNQQESSRYGPQLIRTDCTHYSAGSMLAVSLTCAREIFLVDCSLDLRRLYGK